MFHGEMDVCAMTVPGLISYLATYAPCNWLLARSAGAVQEEHGCDDAAGSKHTCRGNWASKVYTQDICRGTT